MGEKMTLEQVRDGLRNMQCFPDSLFSKWADAIDAHLTQPAQAVDVERWSTDAICEARGRGELTGDEIWIPAAPLPKDSNGAEGVEK